MARPAEGNNEGGSISLPIGSSASIHSGNTSASAVSLNEAGAAGQRMIFRVSLPNLHKYGGLNLGRKRALTLTHGLYFGIGR